MWTAYVIAICLAPIYISCSMADLEISNIEFTAINNLTKFLKENPNINFIQQLTKDSATKRQTTYRLGARVNGSWKFNLFYPNYCGIKNLFFFHFKFIGDNLVATNTRNEKWSTVRDYALKIEYPSTGYGAAISFVEISVNQVSH